MLSDPETVREIFRGDPDLRHPGEANEILIAIVGVPRSSCPAAPPTRGNGGS
jgi:hypothetical protein